MKLYYIGRDETTCDIVINDPSNITSGRHAILKIDDRGRYTVLDCSTNGTYVNGMKIEQNVEVPVTRDDTISFAHIIDLDWSVIPNPARKRKIIIWSSVAGAVAAAVLICGAVCLFGHCKKDRPEGGESAAQVDTLATSDTLAASKDTLATEACDTEKAEKKNDLVKKALKPAGSKATDTEADKEENKDKEEKAAEKPQADEEKEVTNPII